MSGDLLVAENLDAAFGRRRSLLGISRAPVKVLHDVSVRIRHGETVGIVGESGSGKTTLGHALLRLVDVTAGRIAFEGRDITHISEADMRPLRRRMQLIFQDPMASLNPRHSIRRIVLEPMLFHRVAKDEADAERRARAIFERFSLPLAYLDRYPHELSGGQRQRVGIARAALLAPDLVVADEIVSGLDVSTQAQALNLLKSLSRPWLGDGLHQPRPFSNPRHLRPGLRAPCGAGGGGGRLRDGVCVAEERLHPRADRRDPVAPRRSWLARAKPRRRRRDVTARVGNEDSAAAPAWSRWLPPRCLPLAIPARFCSNVSRLR